MLNNNKINKDIKKEIIKEKRRKEIELLLQEQKINNMKPSLCASYIKYGIPNIGDIIAIFKREQDSNEERLYELINALKKRGKIYDENIPIYNKYIREGGVLDNIIKEGELESSLIYNTKYKHYLKHNNVQTARYLATIEFMNSGKKNDIISKFASEKNTLNFF